MADWAASVGLAGFPAETFVNRYRARGWVSGGEPVRDWRRLAAAWWESAPRKGAVPDASWADEYA